MPDQAVRWEDTVVWVGVVAGCLIRREGKFLLVQERQPRVHGLWSLPAGFVDKGETIEQAAVREAREETGYSVELGVQLGVYHEDATRAVKHMFMAHIVGGDLTIQEEEILDAQWFSHEEIAQLDRDGKIRGKWLIDVIAKAKDHQ